MASVVIAAHNEETEIAACLDALLGVRGSGDLEIVVAANGCSDDTAEFARRPGVIVLDLPSPGKAAAINAAERVVASFPRIYLDADVALTANDVVRLSEALSGADSRSLLAVAPQRSVDATGSPWLVRQYYRALDLHPAFHGSLFGRGVIVLSGEGRARFDVFPSALADDFFLDSLFSAAEKQVVTEVISTVHAPSSSRVLLRRLARVRRGNTQIRTSATAGRAARPVEGLGWLLKAVRHQPALSLPALVYLGVTAYAIAASRCGGGNWGHDRGRPQNSAVRSTA